MSDRRDFLKGAAIVTGASLLGTSPSWAGANDRIRVAVLGLGNRGRGLIREAMRVKGVEVVALCDPAEPRLSKAASELEAKTGRKVKQEQDLRKILDDPSIDVVTVATCNHWHALATIWACQANKHVYAEKPVSHNVFEGQKIIEAARKYNRIVQSGTQRRSVGRYRKAMQLLHDGIIGQPYLSRAVLINPRNSIGFKPAGAPPSWLNWDVWLGPAPNQAYHDNLFDYNWNWFWDFGNGEMGNNGSHYIDFSRWGLKQRFPVRIHSTGGRFGYKDQAETPNTQTATFVYEDGTQLICEIRGLYSNESSEWHFYGTEGYMHVEEDWPSLERPGRFDYRVFLGRKKEPEPDLGTFHEIDHYDNFINAVRAGKKEILTCEIEEGCISAAHCHLADISFRLGRELRFDPKTQSVVGDSEANLMLKRQYRSPFVVPEKI